MAAGNGCIVTALTSAGQELLVLVPAPVFHNMVELRPRALPKTFGPTVRRLLEPAVAFRSQDRPADVNNACDGAARRFLQSCASTPEVLCLAWPTLMWFLLIATHPPSFPAPLSPDEAFGNVTAAALAPTRTGASEREGFLDAYAIG